MGFFNRLFGRKDTTISKVQMVSDNGAYFSSWNGVAYESDIVRACVAPRAAAISKLVGKHIRKTVDKDGNTKIDVNPEPYLRMLLEEPNPLMTWDVFCNKLGTQLTLNSNAFALVTHDENGYATGMYPIDCKTAFLKQTKEGQLYFEFYMIRGQVYRLLYEDVIHLREDMNDNEVFGISKMPALLPLMNIVTTTDQGIVHAIKNSSIIRWLLQYTSSTRPEDLKQGAKDFAEAFLDIENGTGVAAVDSKAEAKQVTPNDYVPNAAQMDRTKARIQEIFGINEKIITGSYNEDEFNAWFEAKVEPVIINLQNELTRRLFTKRERGCGNYIAVEAANIACASWSTKLALCAMVDRQALLPNEWRSAFNWAPLPGGDVPLRRLDTEAVNEIKPAIKAMMTDYLKELGLIGDDTNES